MNRNFKPLLLSIFLLVTNLACSERGATTEKTNVLSSYDQKARSEFSHNDVLAFVYQWFAAFDHQKSVDYYLERIAEPVDMQYPDFPIHSKDDFQRWYKGVEENIEWNSHDLNNITVSGNETKGWKVNYDVVWKARDTKGNEYNQTIHQDLEIVRKGDRLLIKKHRAFAK